MTDEALPTEGRSAAVARRVAPDRVGDGDERVITADCTNHCVVVDEAVFVKWLTPPQPIPHAGLGVIAHLHQVGFDSMPELLGVDTYEGLVTALLFEHLPGARDGWEWLLEQALDYADGVIDTRYVIASAVRIGVIGARLHAALATSSSTFPDPVGTVDRSVERSRCLALLNEATGVVDDPVAKQVLDTCAVRLRAAIQSIPDGFTPAVTLHGDLHVGQILDSDGRLVVIDFDGNPMLGAADRSGHRPAAVDLASLVQSVDHVVRMAQKRRPEQTEMLDELATEATEATIAGYRDALADAGFDDLLDDALLRPLRAAQELHELLYAVRHLPRWSYAPTATLRAMFAVRGSAA